MFHRHATALVLIVISAQAQQADIKTSSTEVILDLIVRDKRVRPVKDLASSPTPDATPPSRSSAS